MQEVFLNIGIKDRNWRSRGVCHPSPSTGRTPNPPFARESHQPVVPTRFAVKAQEASFQDAAIQERPELPLYKQGDRPVALLLSQNKSFKFLGDHLIQQALFRMTRSVFQHATFTRGASASSLAFMPLWCTRFLSAARARSNWSTSTKRKQASPLPKCGNSLTRRRLRSMN
jgi:hypothetical protein